MLAKTDDSLKLKRTAVIVSVEVGNVRFDIGALLDITSQRWLHGDVLKHTSFRPIFERDRRQWQTVGLNGGDRLN
jgi:hypothetical protein